MKKQPVTLPQIVDKQYLGNKGYIVYGPFNSDNIRIEVGVAMPDETVQEFITNSVDYSISMEYGIRYVFVKRRRNYATKETI